MKKIGIGLIGTGFMGKAHAMAYAAAAGVFPELPLHPILVGVADISAAAAQKAANQFGFERATTEWQSLIEDPSIDVISITTPNVLHREMAVAAAKAGKHIHCEKPLAPTAKEAAEMVQAAQAAGVVTQVGYNYLKNPLLKLARQMIADGELGEIVSFRGIHAEDYMADPEIPYNWRVDGSGGGGAISEIGSHIIGMARFLVGPIVELSADLKTIVKTRPASQGATARKEVKVDDVAQMVVRFAGGFGGTIEANWLAVGRKMQLGFEITGTKGSLAFTQERLNELLHYRSGGDGRTAGFTRIEAGPQHAPYGEFCPAPGHQLGFGDLKTIEMAEFLTAIAGGTRLGPDFEEALQIQRVIDAAIESSSNRCWIKVN
jgi:predicted dehydrogenase